MLYYCKTPQGNFGDDLNPWLWSRLAPELCDEQDPTLFVAIGTILSHKVPAGPLKVVFGSGWARGPLPKIDRKWTVYCVRGPLTAARLNLDPTLAVVDPAILVRQVNLAPDKRSYPVSFMPHHQSMPKADWPALCERAGLHCIDPRRGVEHVLSELRQTELLLAEAMHGAIVADALRVPWIPVRMYGRFTEFKWRDWTQSIRTPLKLADVPPVFQRAIPWNRRVDYGFKKGLAAVGLGKEGWQRLEVRASTEREIDRSLELLEKLPREQAPCLSSDDTIRQLESRLCEKLSELRRAWPGRKPAP